MSEALPDDTFIDEYEKSFNAIDSELDALRSSIKDDNKRGSGLADDNDEISRTTSLKTSSLVTAYAEQSAAEMEEVVKNLKKQQESLSQPESAPAQPDSGSEQPQSETKEKPDSKKSSPLMIFAILVPIVLAFVAGQSLSSSDSPEVADNNVVVVSNGNSGVTSENVNTGPSVNYKERRKVERCRYSNGEKICETEEQSVSSSDPGGQQQVTHQSTFQKCHYVNGQSYCESFEREFSSDEKPFTRQQLAAEFRDADINHDGQVSLPEFTRYKKLYLQQYPEMEDGFATFADFDADRNGLISVKEHEGYYKALGLL